MYTQSNYNKILIVQKYKYAKLVVFEITFLVSGKFPLYVRRPLINLMTRAAHFLSEDASFGLHIACGARLWACDGGGQ